MTEELVMEEKMESKKVKTFVLLNRSDSDWTLKTTLGQVNPIHLNSPKFKALSMRSNFCLGDGRGYAKTLYVEGAPTIFEDDVYVDEKGNYYSMSDAHLAEKKGFKVQKGLRSLYNVDDKGLNEMYRTAVNKVIGFDFGILALDKFGDDPTLLKYVSCHEENIHAPNAKFNRRPFNRMFIFSSLQEEKTAEKKLDTLDAEADALMYVASLRTKDGKGFKYTQANIDKINATLRILDMKHGLQESDYNQKHLAIRGLAQANPVEFIKFINDEYGSLRTEIVMGMELKVLEFPKKDGKVIKMVTGDKNGIPERRQLLTAESLTLEDQVVELSTYFLTEQGTTDYRDFNLLKEAAKQK